MVVAPLTSNVPKMSVLPVEDATVNLSVLTIKLPPTFAAPLVVKLDRFRVDKVVIPVTPSVPPIVTLPVVPPNVIVSAALGPSFRVCPIKTSSPIVAPPLGIINGALAVRDVGFSFLVISNLACAVMLSTRVDVPVTVRLPCVTTFPLSVSTVNLSTPELFWMLNDLLSALIVTLSWNVAPPSTFRVLSRSVA